MSKFDEKYNMSSEDKAAVTLSNLKNDLRYAKGNLKDTKRAIFEDTYKKFFRNPVASAPMVFSDNARKDKKKLKKFIKSLKKIIDYYGG